MVIAMKIKILSSDNVDVDLMSGKDINAILNTTDTGYADYDGYSAVFVTPSGKINPSKGLPCVDQKYMQYFLNFTDFLSNRLVLIDKMSVQDTVDFLQNLINEKGKLIPKQCVSTSPVKVIGLG